MRIYYIIILSLFLLPSVYSLDYFQSRCFPLANATPCLNTSTGIAILQYAKINWTDVLNTPAGFTDTNNYTGSCSVTGTTTKTVTCSRNAWDNYTYTFDDADTDSNSGGTLLRVNSPNNSIIITQNTTDVNATINTTYLDTIFYTDANPAGYITSYTETDPFYNRSWNQTKADTLYYSISNPSGFITDGNTGWDNAYNFITQTRLIMPSGIWVFTNNTAFQINAGTGISITNDTRGNITITNTVTDTNSGGTLLRITRPNASIVIVQNSTDANISVNVTYLDGFFVGQSEYANLDTDSTNDVLTTSNHVNTSGDINVTGAYNALNLQIGTDVIGDLELNTSQVTLADFTNDAGFITSALLRVTRPNASIVIVQNSTDANISVNVTYLDTFFYTDANPAGYITSYTETDPFYNRSWNQTKADTLYAPITTISDNTSWNQTGASILFQEDIGADCSPGDFAKGIDDDGTIDCATPAGSGDITAVNTPIANDYIYNGTTSGDVNLRFNDTKLEANYVGQTEYANLDTDSTNDLTTSTAFLNGSQSEANITGTYNALIINITESKLDCIAITGSATLCDGNDATGGGGDALLRVNSPNASIVIIQNSTDGNISVNVTYLDTFFYLDTNPSSYITDGNTGWDNSYLFIANATRALLLSLNVSGIVNATQFLQSGLPTLSNNITGNAGTATALAANGANCAAGFSASGVDASGAAETCYDTLNTTDTAGGEASGTFGALVLSNDALDDQYVELVDNYVNTSGDINVTGAYNALNLQIGTDVINDLELNTSQVTLNDFTNDAGYVKNDSAVRFISVNVTGSGVNAIYVGQNTSIRTNNSICFNPTCTAGIYFNGTHTVIV
jgi:hypothetical protein